MRNNLRKSTKLRKLHQRVKQYLEQGRPCSRRLSDSGSEDELLNYSHETDGEKTHNILGIEESDNDGNNSQTEMITIKKMSL